MKTFSKIEASNAILFSYPIFFVHVIIIDVVAILALWESLYFSRWYLLRNGYVKLYMLKLCKAVCVKRG